MSMQDSTSMQVDPDTGVRRVPDDETPWGRRPIVGKFRVMENPHSEGHVPGTYRIDPTGVPMFEPRVYLAGDVVASRSDLSRHNTSYREKFRRVSDSVPDKYDEMEQRSKQGEQKVEPPLREDLEAMTVAQLKKLAEAEGIELDNTMRKDEMVVWIRESRGESE